MRAVGDQLRKGERGVNQFSSISLFLSWFANHARKATGNALSGFVPGRVAEPPTWTKRHQPISCRNPGSSDFPVYVAVRAAGGPPH